MPHQYTMLKMPKFSNDDADVVTLGKLADMGTLQGEIGIFILSAYPTSPEARTIARMLGESATRLADHVAAERERLASVDRKE